MRLQHMLLLTGVPLTAALCVAPASGGTVTAKFNNLDLAHNVQVNIGSGNQTFSAGRFDWTLVSSSGTLLGDYGGGNFKTFCVELTQFVAPGGTYTFNEILPLANLFGGGTSGANIANLLGELYADEFDNVDTAAEAASFQVAVWEIVKDGGAGVANLNLGAGNFTLVSGASLAASYLANLGGGPVEALVGLQNPSNQDQIVLAKAGAVIPLPGAFAAGLPLMLAGATAMRMRQRRWA